MTDISVNGDAYTGVDVRPFFHLFNSSVVNKQIEELKKELRIPGLTRSQKQIIEKQLEKKMHLLGVEKIFQQAFDFQTVTISIYREKYPVRGLGRTLVNAYTRGPATIGGSMILTILNSKDNLFLKSLNEINEYSDDQDGRQAYKIDRTFPLRLDQLPPFDLYLYFSNEHGRSSVEVLYGIEVINSGQNVSIEDSVMEITANYVARDLRPMEHIVREPMTMRKLGAYYGYA